MHGTVPVSEIYGPVAQGEGRDIGLPTIFLRLGGCDFRCTWCDSMFSVLPKYHGHWERLTAEQILQRIESLGTAVKHITLSGGNPAMHECTELVQVLNNMGYRIGIETQGTVFRTWLNDLSTITISPKPPSAGNMTTLAGLQQFLDRIDIEKRLLGFVSLKIVVFHEEDFEYAKHILNNISFMDIAEDMRFLQTGSLLVENYTSFDMLNKQYRHDILNATAKLQEKALADPTLSTVRVLPQLHVLLHGHKRGV